MCNFKELYYILIASFAAFTWSYRFLQFQLESEGLWEEVDQRESIDLISLVSVNHNFGVQRWLHTPT